MTEPSLGAMIQLVLLGALSWWSVRFASRWAMLRMPLAVFVTAYVVTSGIGAALIGLFGPEVLPVTWGMDFTDVRELKPTYWLLVYLPLLVAPLVAAKLSQASQPQLPVAESAAAQELSPLAILVPLAFFCGFCAYKLQTSGYGADVANVQNLSGDFHALMELRGDMMSSLGGPFFGFIYTSMPALCHCALYQAAKRRRVVDWVVFALALAATAIFSLAVVQKTLILLLLLFTALAATELRLLSGRLFLLAGFAGVGVLGALQLFVFQGDSWTALDSVALIIFRLSSSFPYYVNLYPDVLPYSGIDLGLNVIGIGDVPRDQFDVFARAYPDVTIEGAAPAAAHLRAYSQAGLAWSLVTAAFIGLMLYLVAKTRARVRGPLSFAFHIQLLVLMYYLTQTSATEIFSSSYGLIWTLVGVGSVALTQSLMGAG